MLVWQQRVIVMQNMQECDEWSLHIQVFVFPFFLFPFFPCSRLSHWSCLCQGFGVCFSLDIDDLEAFGTSHSCAFCHPRCIRTLDRQFQMF